MNEDESKKILILKNALVLEREPHQNACAQAERDAAYVLLSWTQENLEYMTDAVRHSAWDHVLSRVIRAITECQQDNLNAVVRSVIVAIDSITLGHSYDGLPGIYRHAASKAKDRAYDIAKLAYLGYDPIMNDMTDSVVEARWLRRKGVSVHHWIPDDAVIQFGHIAITAGKFPDVHLVLQSDFVSRDGRITYWLGEG